MVRCWCRQFSEGRQNVTDEDGSYMARRIAAVLTEFEKDFRIKYRKMLVVLVTLALFGSMTGAFAECKPDDCDPGETSCQSRNSDMSGCPYPNGVWCPDGKHCCRKGFDCIYMCYRKRRMSIDPNPLEKRQGYAHEENVVTKQLRFHLCNEETMCFNSTCCEMKDAKSHFKKHGCCPFMDGVCCPDGKYCCKSMETCAENSESCMREDGSLASSFPTLPTLNTAPFHNFIDRM
ncbi:hypothetical protein TNIN_310431 [Trichonephila inaurata madagascariensis]|uniref:Granulins domain-containing protein n=1 Tax=Trichonephila inaurata madagascariensis TaxID=2747483 RepID=A0A8X6I359_9ARAC|nr:hypothetical protein TNIN_310431 [Trichonephila inaurata madagascariensis]